MNMCINLSQPRLVNVNGICHTNTNKQSYMAQIICNYIPPKACHLFTIISASAIKDPLDSNPNTCALVFASRAIQFQISITTSESRPNEATVIDGSRSSKITSTCASFAASAS